MDLHHACHAWHAGTGVLSLQGKHRFDGGAANKRFDKPLHEHPVGSSTPLACFRLLVLYMYKCMRRFDSPACFVIFADTTCLE